MNGSASREIRQLARSLSVRERLMKRMFMDTPGPKRRWLLNRWTVAQKGKR